MATTKQWLVSIDVPIWVNGLGSSDTEWKKLQTLLDDINPADTQLLYRDELKALGTVMPDKHWVLASKMSKFSTIGYPTDEKAKYVKAEPDVLKGVTENNQKVEIQYQTSYVYKRSGVKPRPILVTGRINAPSITLTKDRKNPHVLYVCGTGQGDIPNRLNGFKPILNQDKHFLFERNMGHGRIASTFAAYDRNNTKPAEELLETAFLKYEGEDLPAKSLWTWDAVHDCFVQFMHSGDNEYHGHDEKDITKVQMT